MWLRIALPLALAALLAPGAAALGADLGVRVEVLDLVRVEAEAAAPLELPLPVALDTPVADVEASTGSRAMVATRERALEEAAPEALSVGGGALLVLLLERLGFARLLGAGFYTRIEPAELLDHERRERVVAMVRAQPGVGPGAIAEALGTGWGATMYHLDRLERAGLVTSQRLGHHRCYFLPGAVARDQQKTVALFRGDTTRRVAELLLRRPGLTQAELCRELGLSASAASKQVSRLEAAALVRREPAAPGVRLFPADALTGVLQPAA